jgi:hypothetical protein
VFNHCQSTSSHTTRTFFVLSNKCIPHVQTVAMRPTIHLWLLGFFLGTAWPVDALVVPERHFITKGAKKWVGAAAMATTLVVSPLLDLLPASAVDVPTTDFVVRIDVTDPKALAKSVFDHRGAIVNAGKHFLQSVKKIAADLDGVVPSNAASASLRLPSDPKAAAREAASGKGRVVVNGSPILIEMESEKDFLSLNVLVSSPFLPKIPFLPAKEETLQMPAMVRVEKVDTASVVATGSGFWDSTLSVPVVNVKFKYLQVVEGIALTIPTVYALAYAYYIWENEKGALEAAAKKESTKAKKSPVVEKVPTVVTTIDTVPVIEETVVITAPEQKVDIPMKDIGQARKEVAISFEEMKYRFERLRETDEEQLPKAVLPEPEKSLPPKPSKRRRLKNLLKKIFMPWRK